MEALEMYRQMARVRAFELAIGALWADGKISGEMHLATGEEAVCVGVAAHLRNGDALALDHRGTPMMLLRDVDPVSMLRELLGREDGLCRGRGGHMHLFAPDRLAATSGIVGAAGPLAVGFAMAGRQLRPGSIAVAFFGDGAANQGQMMESWNLAAAWKLPVLFVCKDNSWAITTRTDAMTGGDLLDRARGFGLATQSVDGLDVSAVYQAASSTISTMRKGGGPGFLLARCSRLDGHFLGDMMVRLANNPIDEGGAVMAKTTASALQPKGGGVLARARSVGHMMSLLREVRKDKVDTKRDPLFLARKDLKRHATALDEIDAHVTAQVQDWVAKAVA